MTGLRKALDELLSRLTTDLRHLLEAVDRDPAFAQFPKDRQATIAKFKVNKHYYALVLLGANIEVSLTSREEDVVRLVGGGLGNKGIARRLGLSENTIKNHLKSVYSKTGLRSRAALARYAAVMIDSHSPIG